MKLRWFFAFFLVSGLCSLVYQVVWLRVAMAQFGVTTPQVSIVLSVFMAGLALGSVLAGRLARGYAAAPRVALRLYAFSELVIALSAGVVPPVLALGHRVLASGGGASEWASSSYYVASLGFVTLALLPFCTAMGATVPLAMGAIRGAAPEAAPRSFSYLYVANVVGAALGTLASAFALIELLGFQGTLELAAGMNALLAAAALGLSLRLPEKAAGAATGAGAAEAPTGLAAHLWLLALVATGLVSMAMEVVWVRLFTPYLGNMVYAFATILAVYLVATFAGSSLYRRWARGAAASRGGADLAWAFIGLAGLLPLVAADPRLPLGGGHLALGLGALRVALGIGAFSALAGFLTPMLVDRWSSGDPDRAGRAYAVNVLGCIVGPLLAGFVLVPELGERFTLAALSAPLFAFGAAAAGRSGRRLAPAPLGAVALSLLLLAAVRPYESRFSSCELRRDSTATVVAATRGADKLLLVNGVGMTTLTPITKYMAHLPLAMLAEPPRDVLVICLGMGTSYRSALSWGVRATAVELVPSVPELIPYFHGDGAELLRSPRGRIVVDDGRRFLERSRDRFDAIATDPPPPVSAAGSSLLYSKEFYAAARQRLRPGGILQVWIPSGDDVVMAAFVRAALESFPSVRTFQSAEGWGLHVLASDRPFGERRASVLAARLPEAAARDLVEWGPARDPEQQLRLVLEREVDPVRIVLRSPRVPALRDDHPVNEYFLLRTAFPRR